MTTPDPTDSFPDATEEPGLPAESHHERNIALAAPIVAIREQIAGHWRHITEILETTPLKWRKKLAERILAGKAPSAEIRAEIERLLGQVESFPEGDSGRALLRELGVVNEAIDALRPHRNALAEANLNLVGSFLDRFHTRFDDALSQDEQKQACRIGLNRSAETWQTATQFSTYAFGGMEDVIRNAAADGRKQRGASMDAPLPGDDSATRHDLIEDEGSQQPHAAAHTNFEIERVKRVLSEFPPELLYLRRTIELLYGLDGPVYGLEGAATKLNEEGVRPPKKRTSITPANVREFGKRAVRRLQEYLLKLKT